MSFEEEHISPEDLTKHLEKIIENVKSEKYSSSSLQDIFDITEEYVTNVPQTIDPKIIEYLFRGWWVSDLFNSAGSEECPTCPFCLSSTEITDTKNNENSV